MALLILAMALLFALTIIYVFAWPVVRVGGPSKPWPNPIGEIVCRITGHPGWVDRRAHWEAWWPYEGPPGRHAHWDGISFIGYCIRCHRPDSRS